MSVVVVRFAGGDAVQRTLDALVPQVDTLGGEVLVAHDAGAAPSPSLRAKHPSVRWIAGAPGDSPARLRALGVQASTGRVVACTEDHCIPGPEWGERMLRAHEGTHAIVGGAIDKAPSPSPTAWAAYLLDYGRYMSPLPAGVGAQASDCNVSYLRRDLGDVSNSWKDEFHETTVQWALAARGVPVMLDPAIVVQQHREVELSDYLRERREHGRTYAKTRVASVSSVTRVRFAVLACLLPPVLVMRVRRLVASKPAGRAVPRETWGPLTRAAIAWSAGELDGYLGRR